MVPLMYCEPVKAGKTNSIWGRLEKKPKLHTNPPQASCHTPQVPSPPVVQSFNGPMHHS